MKLEHVELIVATKDDAKELLELQKQSFKKYSDKYGDFDSNPYHMNEKRILFSINYRYGKYYKIIHNETKELIGGIFGFLIDVSMIRLSGVHFSMLEKSLNLDIYLFF